MASLGVGRVCWSDGVDDVCREHELPGRAIVDIEGGSRPASIAAVTNGVHLDHFRPRPAPAEAGSVFVGALDYRPNVAGVCFDPLGALLGLDPIGEGPWGHGSAGKPITSRSESP